MADDKSTDRQAAMNDKAREQLSAFLDGELEPQEQELFLARLSRDASERQRLERYAVIGAAIRNEVRVDRPASIADGVMAKLASERSPAVHSLDAEVPARGRLSAWLKPVAGLAVAASVATVTIVAISPGDDPVGSSPQLISDAGTMSPGFGNGLLNASSTGMQRSTRIDRYLLTHNERSVITGMQGVLPYVRIAGFGDKTEQDQQPEEKREAQR